jgi:hypothetical protein
MEMIVTKRNAVTGAIATEIVMAVGTAIEIENGEIEAERNLATIKMLMEMKG